jgi:hypothetical protein
MNSAIVFLNSGFLSRVGNIVAIASGVSEFLRREPKSDLAAPEESDGSPPGLGLLPVSPTK